jgi:hypothetical protein
MSEKSNCAIAVIGSDIGNRKTAAQCLNYSIRSVVPQWVIFDGFSRDSLLADVRSRSRSSSGGGAS